MFDKLSSAQKARIMILLIIGVGWVMFEGFNIETTWNSLIGLFGSASMGAMLAIAIVTSDIGQLVKTVTPNVKGKRNDLVNTVIPISWILVSLTNCMFTWWSVQMVIDAGRSKMPDVLASNPTYTSAIAVFIAILVFIIRLLLAASFGSVLESELGIVGYGSAKPAQSQPQPQRSAAPSVPAYHSLSPRPVGEQARSAMRSSGGNSLSDAFHSFS